MIANPRVNPFLTPDSDALDNHYREVLSTIAGVINADSVKANHRLMSDYLVLCGKGMVTLTSKPTDKPFWYQLEIVLTDKAKQLLNVPPVASKPTPRRVTGDQVTIVGLRPRQGRTGQTWGHWEAITDDKEYPIIHLYPEDFSMLRRAGYVGLPDWNDYPTTPYDQIDQDEMDAIVFGKQGRFVEKSKKKQRPVEASFPVEIEVILKPERVNGHWRIERVKEPELKWIFVRYDQLVVGDVFQLGNQGDCTVVTIGKDMTGVRYGTVEDSDGVRDFPFSNVSMYTLVKGDLLDAARKDRKLVEWCGNGYRWVGQGRKAG